jgi:hypothetical protein
VSKVIVTVYNGHTVSILLQSKTPSYLLTYNVVSGRFVISKKRSNTVVENHGHIISRVKLQESEQVSAINPKSHYRGP